MATQDTSPLNFGYGNTDLDALIVGARLVGTVTNSFVPSTQAWGTAEQRTVLMLRRTREHGTSMPTADCRRKP